jgi:hypothetical protein
MSSIAISSALSSMSSATQAASTGNSTTVQAVSTTTANHTSANLQTDTVKLSVAAQAKMMHRQGLSASVIAANLGTNVASIDGYLNIKVATQADTTTAASEGATKSTETSTPVASTEIPSAETASTSTQAAETTITKG